MSRPWKRIPLGRYIGTSERSCRLLWAWCLKKSGESSCPDDDFDHRVEECIVVCMDPRPHTRLNWCQKSPVSENFALLSPPDIKDISSLFIRIPIYKISSIFNLPNGLKPDICKSPEFRTMHSHSFCTEIQIWHHNAPDGFGHPFCKNNLHWINTFFTVTFYDSTFLKCQ